MAHNNQHKPHSSETLAPLPDEPNALSWTGSHRVRPGVRPAWLEVDLDALRSNFIAVRAMVSPETKIIPSVKANGYGHGVVGIARVLAEMNVYAFATGCFDDVLALGAAGVRDRVLLFAGQAPEATEQVLLSNVIPTVSNLETARAVSAAATVPTPVFVKVDCGLGRIGVYVDDAFDFVRKVASLPRIVVEGLYTHLPFNDLAGRDWARTHLPRFRELRDGLSEAGIHIPVTQALSSAGVVSGLDDFGCTAVCPGHILYGLSPVSTEVSACSQFHPVLRAIHTEVIQVAHHGAARSMGLGGKGHYAAGTTSGIVPLGLVDGYRPARNGQAEMLIRGQRVRVLSTSLESSTLDLTGVSDVEPGDRVVAIGEDGTERITLEDVAAWQATSALQVLMTFSGRMPVRYAATGREPKGADGCVRADAATPDSRHTRADAPHDAVSKQ